MDDRTSMGLSEKLKGAGAKQESERSWEPIKYPYLSEPNKIHWENRPFHTEDGFSSYNCHELTCDLAVIGPQLNRSELRMHYERIGSNWWVWHSGIEHKECDMELVEALGKLTLWCLQNGHCDWRKV